MRRPARTWWDRLGDCDCYSVFISSLLLNIYPEREHALRITKYPGQTAYSHIYPIVPLGDGTHITIDCVASDFDYEVPYSRKIDKHMQLHYLNGLPGEHSSNASATTAGATSLSEVHVTATGNLSVDALDLMEGADGDLGFLKNFGKKVTQYVPTAKAISTAAKAIRNPAEAKKQVQSALRNPGKTIKKQVSKTIHAVNRVNPGTAILRGGLLLAFKINMFNVAGRLRFGYLSLPQAEAMGIIPSTHAKIQKVLRRASSIFHKAGGKPENMKKAILRGKGNRDKRVLNGLGEVFTRIEPGADVREALGAEIFYSEFPDSMNGLGELGEPVTTAAMITAATGTMTALAAALKSAGDVKHQLERVAGQPVLTKNFTPASPPDRKGKPLPKDGSDMLLEQAKNLLPGLVTSSAAASTAHAEALANGASDAEAAAAALTAAEQENTSTQDSGGVQKSVANPPATQSNTGNDASGDEPNALAKAGQWVKDNPLMVGGIGLAGAGLTYLGYEYYQRKKAEKAAAEAKAQKAKQGLSGTPRKRKRKPSTRTAKSTTGSKRKTKTTRKAGGGHPLFGLL